MNTDATIFIVEDDETVCQSLKWLFGSVQLPVEIFRTSAEYLSSHNPNRYGCLLIDIRLPDMSGLMLQERLVKLNNHIPIIIITGHGDVSLAVRAMKLGAIDFILKPYNNDLLLEKIQEILVNHFEYHRDHLQFTRGLKKLTQREREVLELIVLGKLNKQIATRLDISLSTVENHRGQIMQKMAVASLAELVRLYFMQKNYAKDEKL